MLTEVMSCHRVQIFKHNYTLACEIHDGVNVESMRDMSVRENSKFRNVSEFGNVLIEDNRLRLLS